MDVDADADMGMFLIWALEKVHGGLTDKGWLGLLYRHPVLRNGRLIIDEDKLKYSDEEIY